MAIGGLASGTNLASEVAGLRGDGAWCARRALTCRPRHAQRRSCAPGGGCRDRRRSLARSAVWRRKSAPRDAPCRDRSGSPRAAAWPASSQHNYDARSACRPAPWSTDVTSGCVGRAPRCGSRGQPGSASGVFEGLGGQRLSRPKVRPNKAIFRPWPDCLPHGLRLWKSAC